MCVIWGKMDHTLALCLHELPPSSVCLIIKPAAKRSLHSQPKQNTISGIFFTSVYFLPSSPFYLLIV